MLYAAYGSNLHPDRLRARVDSAQLVGTPFLNGWCLHFNKLSRDGSGKCTISRDVSSGIYLAVFEIETDQLMTLDSIEGVGTGYERIEINVPEHGACATYIGTHIDENLRPYTWYRDLVLLGCRFHGFPDIYLDSVAGVSTQDDPDHQRATLNRALLEKLSLNT